MIHLYTICWNEEYMLKYFFKYYDQIVDHYVFFDDGSTDKTLEILGRHPKVEIRKLPRVDIDSYLLAAKEIHNNCWKESCNKADWVIITAVDEFLYVPDLKSYLDQCKKNGVTAIPALGYQMISQTHPTSDEHLIDLVKTGSPWLKMNKLSIFNPNKIIATNQVEGRHSAIPSGEIKFPDEDQLLNLHYKYLSFDWTFNRHAELQTKLGSFDKQQGWGHKYGWSRELFKKDWDFFEQNLVKNVFSELYNPNKEHSEITERWWRKTEGL